MFGFRIARLLTSYLAAHVHRPVAVLLDPATGAIEAYALDTRNGQAFDVGTAPVNVQRFHAGTLKGRVIITSEAPLIIDLGMAALTQVTDVVYAKLDGIVRYAPGNEGAPAGKYTDRNVPALAGPVAEWVKRCEDNLAKGDSNAFVGEFEGAPEAEGWRQRIGEVIGRDEVTYGLETPDAPPGLDGAASAAGPEVDMFWMQVARRLAGVVHIGANKVSGSKRHGHNIACILVDANQRVLAWGVNTIENHPTRHAETKCMWMYQRLNPGAKVPAGSTLYTTLQSCLMCAATIKHACADNAVRVVYGEADKVGAKSVLSRMGGAVEIRLVAILDQAHRGELLAGQMMLARARWGRLREAFTRRIDLPENQRGAARRDARGLREFMTNMLAVPTMQQRMEAVTALDREKLDPGRQQQLDAYRGTLEKGPAMAGPLRERREALHAAQTAERRAAIAAHDPTRTRILNDAQTLRHSGGAPVLLQNPRAIEVLYTDPAVQRTGPVSTDVRLRDIATNIHGLDLLLQVLREYPGYKRS